MPSVSKKQRNLMGLALSYKRGETQDVSQKIKDIADRMSEKQLSDFASTKNSELENEAMSISARKKMGRMAKKNAKKSKRKREKLKKKKKNPDQLRQTAERKAKDIIIKKMMNKPKEEMTMQDKILLSKKIDKKRGIIKKIAKKILPKIKAAENDRIAKIRAKKIEK